MEFSELNRARHSVRHYDGSRTLTKEEVTELVREAQEAPSWKNIQSVRYYAVIDPAEKKAFAEACLPPFNVKNVDGAAALIAITFVPELSGFRMSLEDGGPVPANEMADMWGTYDAGLATAHLLLAAKNRGLDSLVLGIRDAVAIGEMLRINRDIVVSVVAIGYAAADVPPTKPPRLPVEKVLRFPGVRPPRTPGHPQV